MTQSVKRLLCTSALIPKAGCNSVFYSPSAGEAAGEAECSDTTYSPSAGEAAGEAGCSDTPYSPSAGEAETGR